LSAANHGVVLWDVDGTLVRTAGLGTLAFFEAFEVVFGRRPPDDAGVYMAGKTDPQIAMELLHDLNVDDAEGVLPDILAALERALAGLADRIRDEGWVLPGVASVIDAIAARSAEASLVQTLLTGNLEPNARVKLQALGLGRGIEYEVGAYGSDAADRTALVPIALQRLAATGRVADPSRCWVVGDTPRDFECARAGGVRCLLVATGTWAFDDLAALDADAVLPDMSDTDLVLSLLTGR